MVDCACLSQPQGRGHYTATGVGVDATNGRFGEVSVLRCKTCGRAWLHYSVEYEGFSGSGRFFMGQVSDDVVQRVSPETAADELSALDWYFAGGSHFGRPPFRASGPPRVDL